jgi:hypothetical protein
MFSPVSPAFIKDRHVFLKALEKGTLEKSMGSANALAELMDISPPTRCRNATSSNAVISLQSLSGQASRRFSR